MYANILIIEDDEVIREELVQFLENAGYGTLAPDLDRNMIDTIRNLNTDLILLDINLPDFAVYLRRPRVAVLYLG